MTHEVVYSSIVAPTIEIRKMMIGLCTLPRMATPSIAPVP